MIVDMIRNDFGRIAEIGTHDELLAANDRPDRAAQARRRLSAEEREKLAGLGYTGAASDLEIRADGVPAVRQAARNNLAAGAHFIKVLGGGGIYSFLDPLESLQYSAGELKAAAEEATNYGTYATIHAHTDEAVSRAIDLGFKMIEHATIMEEDTVKKMSEKDVIWSMQLALFMIDPATNPSASSDVQRRKAEIVYKGMTKTLEHAKNYDLKILWGTDIIGSKEAFFETFPKEWEIRNEHFTPFEQLQQVTKNNGEMVAMSGPKNPYPEGPLGVIEEGAYADILIVDGNPLEDLDLIADPEANFDLIMKDGVPKHAAKRAVLRDDLYALLATAAAGRRFPASFAWPSLGMLAVAVLFHARTRYRVAAMPALSLVAAEGIVGQAGSLAERPLAAALAVGLGAVGFLGFSGAIGPDPDPVHVVRSTINLPGALSLDLNPASPGPVKVSPDGRYLAADRFELRRDVAAGDQGGAVETHLRRRCPGGPSRRAAGRWWRPVGRRSLRRRHRRRQSGVGQGRTVRCPAWW